MGRRRAVPFVVVGESPGVERREDDDCWRVGRDEELDTRSDETDALG